MLKWDVDEKDLVLRITAQPELLTTTVLPLQRNRPPNIIYGQNLSGFVNYAVNLSNFKDVEAVTEAGVSYQGNLLLSSVTRKADGQVVRGLTSAYIDNREKLTRWVIGDSFPRSVDALGGNVTLGGVSYGREFSLDPYFIRYPTLGLSDAVMTPSRAAIYVNGLLVREVALPPGRFELKDLPLASGAGVTRVVIRDAFGHEREIVSPYYFTSSILQPGLQEFSYNLGVRRNHVASASWDYDRPVFLGVHRIGLTDALTAGLRLEADSAMVSAGPTGTALLPYGQIEFSAGASRAGSLSGIATYMGYSYRQAGFGFGASVRGMSDHYANLSQRASDDRAHVETNFFSGVQITPRTSLDLQYSFSNSHAKGAMQRISLSGSTRLSDTLNLVLTGRHSRSRTGSVIEMLANLGIRLGSATANLSYQRNKEENAGGFTLQESLPVGSGFGYRVQASGTKSNYQATGIAQYQGPWGRYEARYDRTNQQNLHMLSAAGALVGIGNSIFASRPILDGFTLINVPGTEGVRGYASNQEVGQTDAHGNLLIPNLLSYYGNRIRVADEDIPIDYRIESVEQIVAPPYRGGTVATFPVQRIQILTGRIILESGAQLTVPAYGGMAVSADGKQFETPLGMQGEFYLENVPAGRHEAIVEHESSVCRFTIVVPSLDTREIKLGTLRCPAQ